MSSPSFRRFAPPLTTSPTERRLLHWLIRPAFRYANDITNLRSGNGIAPWIFLAGLICQGLPAEAAPRIPDSDSAVLERLPIRMNDPAGRALRALRDAVAANPRDRDAALRLARRYFDLASAEGDPRYIGYAEAVIRPWSTQTDAPADIPEGARAQTV